MKPPTPEEMDRAQLRANIERETRRQLGFWLPYVVLIVGCALVWWLQ